MDHLLLQSADPLVLVFGGAFPSLTALSICRRSRVRSRIPS